MDSSSTEQIQERPLLIGVSGQPSGCFGWSTTVGLQHVGPARENFSVYAAALSPDGRRVAAATKSPGGGAGLRGYLQVWDLPEDPEHPASGRGSHYALPRPAFCVEWLSDSLCAVGTYRNRTGAEVGCCLLYQIGEDGTCIPAEFAKNYAWEHPASVVLVRHLGDDQVLTVGQEGGIKVWKLSTGEMISEFGATLGAKPLPLLPHAEVFPSDSRVLIQLPSGELKILTRGEHWTLDAFPPHPGPAGGFTFLGDELLFNAWQSPLAQCWKVEEWAKKGDAPLSRPFRSLRALDPTTVAALYLDGSVGIWSLDPALTCRETLSPAAVRCLGGGPPPSLLSKQIQEQREEHEGARLQAFRSSLQEIEDLASVRHQVEELSGEGYGFEALVMLADACRQRGKSIAELFVRQELCALLPEVPESALHWRVYADLLLHHGENQLAREALSNAMASDPQLIQLQTEIDQIPIPAEPHSGRVKVHLPVHSGGDPGEGCRIIQERCMADEALAREIPRAFAAILKSSVSLGNFAATELGLDSAMEEMRSSLPGDVDLLDLELVRADGVEALSEAIHFLPEGGHKNGLADISLCVHLDPQYGEWEYRIFLCSGLRENQTPKEVAAQWRVLEVSAMDDGSYINRRLQRLEEVLTAVLVRKLGEQSQTQSSVMAAPVQSADNEEEEDEFI